MRAMINIFKTRKKFSINECDPVYKVQYLGNVQTALMKGEGCVDKPTAVLWNNYARSQGSVGIPMTITLTNAGMQAVTEEQGLTEYRAHRISYCVAHSSYPRLFVWVYRHEVKKMKVELRCHAVLCKSEEKAKAMAVQLHDKLTFSLAEFMRDKTRRQNSRLALQRTLSLGGGQRLSVNNNNSGINPGVPLRQKMLSTGGKFKPSVQHSSAAPKLLSITEDNIGEGEELAEQILLEEAEQEEDDISNPEVDLHPTHRITSINPELGATDPDQSEDLSFDPEVHDLDILQNGVYDLEIGNDIEEFKRDARLQRHLMIDSDDNSSESGFSEQDAKESNASTGSSNSAGSNNVKSSTSNSPGSDNSSNSVGSRNTGKESSSSQITGSDYTDSANSGGLSSSVTTTANGVNTTDKTSSLGGGIHKNAETSTHL